MYFPVAAVLLGVMAFGILRFFTFENTAITTLPPAEQVAVLVTATPQATPTRPPTAVPTQAPTAAPTTAPAAAPTQAPTSGGGAAAGASFAEVQAILKAKCGACHGDTAMGGLNVGTYASLMKGGASGPVVVAKDADGSALIKKMAGAHPAQFSADELAAIKAWIAAGAIEGAAAAPAPAPGGSKVTFVKDIQPLFASKCAACHGTMGGLTLTSFESVMHGGTSGPAVTPKDATKSSIVKKMEAGGHSGQINQGRTRSGPQVDCGRRGRMKD